MYLFWLLLTLLSVPYFVRLLEPSSQSKKTFASIMGSPCAQTLPRRAVISQYLWQTYHVERITCLDTNPAEICFKVFQEAWVRPPLQSQTNPGAKPCNSLKSLTIPNSVTSIRVSAFEGCSSEEFHDSNFCDGDWLFVCRLLLFMSQREYSRLSDFDRWRFCLPLWSVPPWLAGWCLFLGCIWGLLRAASDVQICGEHTSLFWANGLVDIDLAKWLCKVDIV